MVVEFHYIIYGKVRGVGFRYFAKETAMKFSILGWIRNRQDGAVEGEASGESGNIVEFFNTLSRGNFLSKVSSIETSSIEKKDFSNFEIKF